MKKFLSFIVLTTFVTLNLAYAQEVRTIRQAPNSAPSGSNINLQGEDFGTTLGYMNRESDILLYWTMPYHNDAFYDSLMNVRFSPPERGYFRLLKLRIPLSGLPVYNEDDEVTGYAAGEPGMRVYIWNSGDVGLGPGYPLIEEPIATIDVDPGDLILSGDTINTWTYNVIDLEDLEISFNDSTDFHIGVNLIAGDDEDTLALFSDFDDEYDRSMLWSSTDGFWKKANEIALKDINGISHWRSFNFAMWAVITDELNVDNPREIVLGPKLPSDILLFDPAYPNPFNQEIRLRFSVQNGVTYEASLMDISGRRINLVSRGIGNGTTQQVSIHPDRIPTGQYLLRLETDNDSQIQRVLYLR